MKSLLTLISLLTFTLLTLFPAQAQRNKKNQDAEDTSGLLADSLLADVKFRSIGPAFMSGRIADLAIHPNDENVWYVAVGSGGVWKTENAGVTWQPLFDEQPVYSIGSITIDPSNPNTLWVGSGENVGGRHVGYGDGVYQSTDGGQSWQNMGLKESQHISKIIVHPEDPNTIWVAAQGPLWSPGGERGLYRSTDGGQTWNKTLGDDEWTGVTDIAIDPRDPQVLYAATWQRHRNVAAYMGGGPGSGLHRSTDGGATWEELTNGLPESNMGKIGLAISPQKPDVLYAAIELDRRTGGLYKSEDRGASWKKMSDAVSGATGPHYYQELYASPHQFDKLYLVDVRMQVSDDGGATFRTMKEEHKHSDNHAIAFKPSDPNYLLVGTDGGLYESFDDEANWRFVDNLPITQYYKVAVDDAEPFYNIYGGTQDNNTHGGPSRTTNVHGIRNADWFVTLFGDGHQPATEPGNPDIVYSEWQQGNLVRTDRTTGEIVYIQPQPAADEDYERFNWDAPILVSPHDPKRLYFASQRVWRSDNRGDSWDAISEDLTKDQNRLALPIMGETQSYDNAWDLYAMSNYNTITSLAESPQQAGLLYAGTDDGIIQVTEDGGDNWRKIEVGSLPGVPATAFVNDIKADLYDVNKVYVALDNHKYGDLQPYLLSSSDRGQTWQSLHENLPDSTLVWRIVQDHEKPELMFLATEFGIYTTLDAGEHWTKMKGGLPTISFRDLAIQRRENDLVGASFGRSFYVLDDYSFLRDVTEAQLAEEGALFEPRRAWWYIPRLVLGMSDKGSQGAAYYVADNPEFGATFTYYLKDDLKSAREQRQEAEKKKLANDEAVAFPGWDTLEAEEREQAPKIWLTVQDSSGQAIRRLEGQPKAGFHRISWDLRYPAAAAIALDAQPLEDEEEAPTGMMVAPGTYTVSLAKEVNGTVTELAGPVAFRVEKLQEGALPSASPEVVASFWKELREFEKERSALDLVLKNAMDKAAALQTALARTTSTPGDLDKQLYQLRQDLMSLEADLHGSKAKRQVGEKTPPSVDDRFSTAAIGTTLSTYGPTPMHRESMDLAQQQFGQISAELGNLVNNRIPKIEQALRDAGAPLVEGQAVSTGEE